MKNIILNINTVKLLLLMTVSLLVCNGFTYEPDAMNRARIKPTLVKLAPLAEQQFYVVKEPGRLSAAFATNKVTWFVNGILGGNETVGKITKDGIYQAPKNAPESPEIHIEARINTGSNKILWATVLFDGIQPSYKTVAEWGELKNSLKHLKDPTSFALEQDGNILITDGIIKRFSNSGAFIDEIGETKGEYEGSISNSLNVAVDKDGLIFVCDDKAAPFRIQTFTPKGRYLYGFAPKGTSDKRVMDTRGMAFNSKQQLYVGDIDNIRVSAFEHSGDLIQTFGAKGAFPGELNVPYGLAIDSNDDLFVVSYFGPCQKFTPDGHFLFDFSFPNPPNGPIFLTDIASDRWGNVYLIVKGTPKHDKKIEVEEVSESNKNEERYEVAKDDEGNPVHIMKYNNNGDFVANIQLAKVERNALRLIVDSYGKIYVLFNDNEKIGVEILEQ